MNFDPENNVVKLCAEGMAKEGAGLHDEARTLFLHAWDIATNDFEKFTAAHYVARQQKSIGQKLKWDLTALELAQKIDDDALKASYPSLYLNVAKCYEDLADFSNAHKHYILAASFATWLPNDGYGNMIRAGISNGIERVSGSYTPADKPPHN